MADISTEELKNEIHAVLKTADLSVVSAKKVREQVEKKLECSLVSRKKEFDKIVMDFINAQQDEESEEEEEDKEDKDDKEDESASEEEASSEEEKKPTKKRSQPAQRKAAPAKKKRKSLTASDSGSESDAGSDSDFEVPKKKKAKAEKTSGNSGRRATGFTRSYNLSPELSALMGAEALPRHEVVKKVWAIIKERNLYDPKNKQFAICDDELLKVMKVKRFRTFGMLKHLKPHFLE